MILMCVRHLKSQRRIYKLKFRLFYSKCSNKSSVNQCGCFSLVGTSDEDECHLNTIKNIIYYHYLTEDLCRNKIIGAFPSLLELYKKSNYETHKPSVFKL